MRDLRVRARRAVPLPRTEPSGLHARLRAAEERAARAEAEADAARADADTAQARAGALLAALTSAEEGVRARLAAELHDGTAQSLARARVLLADVAASGGVPTTAEIVEVAETVHDAEEQVRAVTARLRPPQLRDGDLATAVVDLRDDLALRYGLAVAVTWPAVPVTLPLSTAVTVFRFASEALLNVAKHAEVDEARLRLSATPQEVCVEVEDEGEGFDPTRVRAALGRHVGLGLLRERARLAGGDLEVVSAPGAGTTLRLRLPGPAPARG